MTFKEKLEIAIKAEFDTSDELKEILKTKEKKGQVDYKLMLDLLFLITSYLLKEDEAKNVKV